ncbi:hypothetical protein AGMMS50229_21610 [Campylobacterota bacterium]|nr:hypothetical protein AGMMS50229_21610 [Campylobacterota bacterium]
MENGELHLHDLSSLNGVTHQGFPVTDTILENGEFFYIGNISFMVKLAEEVPDIPIPPSEPRNKNGVYEGAPRPARPVKLPPFPLNSSIPAGSSTQYIPLPPAPKNNADNRISPKELSDIVDLTAAPPKL